MSQILDSEFFISCALDQYLGTGDDPSKIKKGSCMEIGLLFALNILELT